jgi:hypothetical protein
MNAQLYMTRGRIALCIYMNVQLYMSHLSVTLLLFCVENNVNYQRITVREARGR